MGLVIYVSLLLLIPKILNCYLILRKCCTVLGSFLLHIPQKVKMLGLWSTYSSPSSPALHHPLALVEGFPWWVSPLQGKGFSKSATTIANHSNV